MSGNDWPPPPTWEEAFASHIPGIYPTVKVPMVNGRVVDPTRSATSNNPWDFPPSYDT